MAPGTANKETPSSAPEVVEAILSVYAINDAMNQIVLKALHRRAWRASLPGHSTGEGRTIAAIFAHLHNCRLNWIRNSAPHLKCPKPLDPDRCTMKQAASAHRESARQCLAMLKDALSGSPNRQVKQYSRGSWAPVWPAGGAMFCYMFAHEAHHRGQILMLAHQLGHRVPNEYVYSIWQWDRLWKLAGMPRPR